MFSTLPSIITIKKNENSVIILACGNMKEKDILNILKKRLFPTKNPYFYNVIEKIPDIVWLISDANWTRNYKGITIVSSDASVYVEYDGKGREINFIKHQDYKF